MLLATEDTYIKKHILQKYSSAHWQQSITHQHVNEESRILQGKELPITVFRNVSDVHEDRLFEWWYRHPGGEAGDVRYEDQNTKDPEDHERDALNNFCWGCLATWNSSGYKLLGTAVGRNY